MNSSRVPTTEAPADGPTIESHRIGSLDVLRGFAVLGSLALPALVLPDLDPPLPLRPLRVGMEVADVLANPAFAALNPSDPVSR